MSPRDEHGSNPESLTSYGIRPGAVISLRRQSWPVAISVDNEATPIVEVPLVLRREMSSFPPPPVSVPIARADDEITTKRLDRGAKGRSERWLPTQAFSGVVGVVFFAAALLGAGALERPRLTHASHAQAARAAAVTELAPLRRAMDDADALRAPALATPAPAPARAAASPEATASDALAHERWSEARVAFGAIVACQPKNVEALTSLGDAYRGEGDFASARALYDRALELAPSYVPARIGRADLLWASGARAEAAAQYASILDVGVRVPAYVATRAAGAPSSTEAR